MAYSQDVEVTLIRETITKDSIGQDSIELVSVPILARVKSVSRSEFFQAKQSRFSCAYTFETNPVNYNGEKLLKYNGETYSIYRTFRMNADSIELYVEEKIGDTGLNVSEASNG